MTLIFNGLLEVVEVHVHSSTWPWPFTHDLEIQQGSNSCRGTCSCKGSCKISSSYVQRQFMSYNVDAENNTAAASTGSRNKTTEKPELASTLSEAEVTGEVIFTSTVQKWGSELRSTRQLATEYVSNGPIHISSLKKCNKKTGCHQTRDRATCSQWNAEE